MAKGLFVGLPLHGHTNPSLPLVKELVARGDDIVYLSTAMFADRITATGARYRAYRNRHLEEIAVRPLRVEELVWTLMRTTGELLETGLETWRAEQPDYIVTDSVAPWGHWIGEVLRVPVITSVTTFAFNRHVLAFGASRGVRPKSLGTLVAKIRNLANALRLSRRLQRRYRVKGPGVTRYMLPRSDVNIVYTSRYFQPCEETFDDRFHFIGPSLDARSDAPDFPWDAVTHPAVIYISLGTLFNRDASFYTRCFDAFRDADLQVIMSVGAQVDPAALGEPPANVIVRRHVPQLDVLRRVRAFVTHGGMNSVSESLSHAVPLVVIPDVGEQMIVARRVEQLGAGRYLAQAEATPDAIRGAVQAVLTGHRYREQADRVRQSFLACGGPSRGAEVIRAYVRERR